MIVTIEGLGEVAAEFTYTRADVKEGERGRGAPLTAYCAVIIVPDGGRDRFVQGHQIAYCFNGTSKETLRKGALTVALRNAKLTKDQRRQVWGAYFKRAALRQREQKVMAAA